MKRIFALLLVMCAIPYCVNAEEFSVRLSMPYGSSSSFSVSSQALSFPEDAHQYDHSLCKLSFLFALSSFGMDGEAQDASSKAFLNAFGFQNIKTMEYTYNSPDTIGSIMGHQVLPDGREILAVALRSNNYGLEWVSNFDASVYSGHHRGFYLSAKKIVARIETYIQENELNSPVVWLTGYSRGAAVANLTAALLDEKEIIADEHIFAYTFATPRCVQLDISHDHFNIFNLLQEGDPVTHVPLKEWGYGYYGVSLYLPTSVGTENYTEYLPGYQQAFINLSGAEDLYADDTHILPRISAAIQAMARISPTPDVFQTTYEPIIRKILLSEPLTSVDVTLIGVLASNILSALDPANASSYALTADLTALDVNQLLPIVLPCVIKHMPDTYYCMLLSLPDETPLFENPLSVLH